MKDFLQTVSNMLKEEDPVKRLQMFNDNQEELKKYEEFDPDVVVTENQTLKDELSTTKDKLNEVTMAYFDTFGKSGGSSDSTDTGDSVDEEDEDELEPLSLMPTVRRL